jgi:hypothetical protein
MTRTGFSERKKSRKMSVTKNGKGVFEKKSRQFKQKNSCQSFFLKQRFFTWWRLREAFSSRVSAPLQ